MCIVLLSVEAIDELMMIDRSYQLIKASGRRSYHAVYCGAAPRRYNACAVERITVRIHLTKLKTHIAGRKQFYSNGKKVLFYCIQVVIKIDHRQKKRVGWE